MRKLLWLSVVVVISLMSRGLFAQPPSSNQLLKRSSQRASTFEENKGQYPSEVKFRFRKPGLDAWVTNTGVVYDRFEEEYLRDSSETSFDPLARFRQAQNLTIKRTGHTVRMKFANANDQATIITGDTVAGHVNYFYGSDPSKWVTNVRSFEGFSIEDLYPGIDAIYAAEQGSYRYDLNVRPGADPNAITLKFIGANKLLTNTSGQLIIRTSLGDLEEADLRAYQMQEGKRVPIDCQFTIVDDSMVRFSLGNYDRLATLVIDPLVYSTFLGASGDEQGNAIVVDNLHNAYITGATSSHGLPGFPIVPGAYQLINNGNSDVFVSKLNPTGDRLIYSTYIGGAFNDIANAIAIDALGDVFITGQTSSHQMSPPAFPTTAGAFQSGNNGPTGTSDAFALELNPTGNALIYSTYLGGAKTDIGTGIALDQAGNAFVCGATMSSSVYPSGYPTTAGAYQALQLGSESAFVTKLDATGTPKYSTLLGGLSASIAAGIVVDASGRAVIVGTATTIPTTAGAYQPICAGNSDAFVTSFSANGAALTFSTFIGGSGTDFGTAITTDGSGSYYITGMTQDGAAKKFPTSATAFQSVNNGFDDAFVTKLIANGSSLIYSTLLGGYNDDYAYAIAVDSDHQACITGLTKSFGNYPKGFPVTRTAFQMGYDGYTDVFVASLGPIGNSLKYSTYLGGSSDEVGYGIACDQDGYIYLTGETASGGGPYPIAFPTTLTAIQKVHGGGKLDVFVTKIGRGFTLVTVLSAPVLTGMCDTGAADILFQNFGTTQIQIDGISTALPLAIAGISFPIVLPPDSSIQLSLIYFPQKVGPDSSYATIHFSVGGVPHDTIILIREFVRSGTKLQIETAHSFRGSPCAHVLDSIRIRDSSCDVLHITSVSVSGTDAQYFLESYDLTAGIFASKDGYIKVTFVPPSGGTYKATLDITFSSNEGSTHEALVNLIGFATASSRFTWGPGPKIKGNACDSLLSTITCSAVGCDSLKIIGAILSGPDGGRFQTLTPFPFTVGPDSLATIRLACTTRTPGIYHCLLNVLTQTTDRTEHDTIFAITATIVNGASYNFSKSITIVGSSCDSMVGVASISSIACGGLQIEAEWLTGSDSLFFLIETPQPLQVSSNDSAHILIKCIGTAQRKYSALLHLHYQLADGSTHDTTIALTATLESLSPKLQAIADDLDLGSVQDCQFADTTFALRNIGCDTLRIDSLQSTLAPGFSLVGATFPVILAPDSEANFHIHFIPQGTGLSSADLVFNASEQGRTGKAEVLLHATAIKGTSTLSLSDTTLDFGNVSVCSHRMLTAHFSSTGCDSVGVQSEVLSLSNGYTLLDAHASKLAPGAQDSISISFAPPSNGLFVSEILVNTSVGTKRIHLIAQGVPDSGRVELSSTALTFASVTASCDSSRAAFVMRNTSCASITVDSVTLGGVGNSIFTITTSRIPLTLPTDSSFSISSMFRPSTTKSYSGSLTIWYHRANGASGDTTISLTGVGIAPPASGFAIKQQALKMGTDGFVHIPVYLTGRFDKVTAQQTGLKSAQIVLEMNSDLLTAIDVQPAIALPTPAMIKVTKTTTTLSVPMPSDLNYIDTTILLDVRCKTFVTDTSATSVRLVSGSLQFANPTSCVSELESSGTTSYAETLACTDSITMFAMDHKLEFIITLISPNPAKDEITIALAKRTKAPITYTLFNALGVSVRSGNFTSETNAINLNELQSGSYYLRLTTPTLTESRKIVVQH